MSKEQGLDKFPTPSTGLGTLFNWVQLLLSPEEVYKRIPLLTLIRSGLADIW